MSSQRRQARPPRDRYRDCYRVEQTAIGARVLVAGSVDAETLRGQLEVALTRGGLTSAVDDVELVDAVPRTAVGKRQRFVPHG